MSLNSKSNKSLSLLEGVSEMVFRISTLTGEILEYFVPEHINLWLPRDEIVGFNILKLKGMLGLGDIKDKWINGDQEKTLNEIHEIEVNNKVLQVSLKISGQNEVFAILKEITVQKRSEKALLKKNQLIQDLERGLSTHIGSNFFDNLVIFTAQALNSDYAFIAEYNPLENKNKTLAVSRAGEIIENIEYSLEGTPCDNLQEYTPIVYEKNVSKLFPKFKLLKDLKVQGYVGIPLFSNRKEKLGVLVGFYTNPIEDFEDKLKILQLFSGRAIGEIERLQVDRLLQENEKRYKNLYQNTPGMFHSVNAKDEIIDVGDFWLEKMGYTREEVIGKKSIEFLSEECWDYAKKIALPKFYKDGYLKDIEYQFLTKKGKKLDVLLSAVLEKEGDVVKALVVLNDVTAINKAKRTLAKSEEKYREIFNSITDIYYKTNADGIIKLISPSIEYYSGYKPEELIGKPTSNFLIDIKENKLLKDRLIAGEKINNVEINAIDKNGNAQTMSINLTANFNDIGNFAGTTGIIRDMTDHNRMVKISQESSTKYKSLFEKSSDAVIIIDANSKLILDANQKMVNMSGYSKKELSRKTIFNLRDKENFIRANRQFIKLLKDGSQTYQTSLITKTKSKLNIEGSASVLTIDGKKVVQAFIRDITERKREEKVTQLNRSILEKLAQENDIYDILNSTCLGIESINPDMICSVLTFDEANNCLNYGAGPRLPKFYIKAVDNFPVGPKSCSCGTAVYYKKTTIVSDIENDPLWRDKKDIAAKAKLKACWSTPMISSKGSVLGTFAIYFKEKRKPKKHELELMNNFNRLIGIALENNRTKNDLILNEKKYRQLVDNSPMAILIHTRGVIKFVNKEVLRIGKAQSESQLLGRSVMDFVIPQFKKEVEVRIKKTAKDKMTLPRLEEQFLCIDKSIIDVEVMATPIVYQGEPSAQLVFYDITERKIAEKELKKSEERHRSLNDSVLDAIIITNDMSNIISWNRGAEKVFGYKEMEALTMPIKNVIPGRLINDGKSKVDEGLYSNKKKSKGNIIEAEGINNRKELFPVEVSTSSWLIGKERFYSAIVRDISGRRAIEIKQKSLNDYLIKQNKQLEEFAHIASHNLRAPIANIEALLQLHLSDNSEETSTFIFEQLGEVSGNLIETIDELTEVLQTSWELNKKKQRLSFSQMFIKITNNLSRNIKDSAVTIKHDFGSIDTIEYPKVYLESIMQNLIQNAIKYRNPENESWVKVKTELSNKGLVLHVEDNGLGIDLKKHEKKLFGLRKTFHKNEDARGVGLFITKAQINSMGGEVEVKSIVNKGTKFSVYFDANNE